MISTDRPTISIIIVNYHSEVMLAACLRSIEEQSVAAEVIVVDNGSDVAAVERLFAQYPGVSWMNMRRNVGFGAACNAGAQIARTSNLLFLNPDTELCPDALDRLTSLLHAPECGRRILGCAIFDQDGGVQLSCRRFPDWRTPLAARFSILTRLFPGNSWSRRYLMTDFNHGTARQVDWVSGAAVAMRRSVFQELSGFDESFFMYFEDVDLCRRGALRHIETWYVPDVRVTHLIGGSSSGAPVSALWRRHHSMWIYYRRYFATPGLDLLAACCILGRFFAVALAYSLADRVHFADRQAPAGERVE